MRILIIEDDADIAAAIAAQLTRVRCVVEVESNGERGLDRLLRNAYAAAVVDVTLPGRNGIDICSIARREKIGTPLLILSARDSVEDRVRGLYAGADDYLVKPFDGGELEARLHALIRRAERAPDLPEARLGNVRIDPLTRAVDVAGAELDLGLTEFRLFEFLMRNRGITLSRSQILSAVWDYDFDGSSNIVDVYVSQLRRKLRRAGATIAIETLWGVGYKLVDGLSSNARSRA